MRKMVIALGLILFAFHGFASTANADAWSDSYSSDTGERFIPIELWTGMPWYGSRNLALTKATRDEKRTKIFGPEDFKRPNTGEKLSVYRRTTIRRGNEEVVQLFAVTSRKDGLGRVYDSRYNRNCVDAVKFPLGLWRQGETRKFIVECERRPRKMSVTIEEIDYTYDGKEHSLRFRWIADGGTRKGTDNSYIYSPNKSIVRIIYHTK